ncbi:MAG: phenylacetate--CoA ligase family protein [Sulfurifustaceae bacterium]
MTVRVEPIRRPVPRDFLGDLRKELHYAARALLRDNAVCDRLVNRLRNNERLPRTQMAEMQNAMLLRTLRAAARNIGRYRRYAPAIAKLEPASAADFLRDEIPIITKEDLLADRDAFYPGGGKLRPWTIVGRTSGTTGSPLEVIRSPRSILWANAFKKRHWTWSGFREGMPRAMLRGDLVVPPDCTRLPVWFYNRYNRQLIVSSRHLKPPFLPYIVDALRKFSPFLLEAYPSTAYELALYLQQHGETLAIPYVYTGSEALYPHQRALIEQSFATTVMDHYGMAERVAYATECEFGNLHVNPDYSYVEIVDENGAPTSDYGSLVGTTFHNLRMPLLRYKLSDMAKWKAEECRCGRRYPMIHPVTGKYEDMIWGADGAPVSPSVITFAFKELKHVRRSQVAQVGPGRWQIRLVPEERFSDADREGLLARLKHYVDANLDVSVVVVQDIPRTAAGKYKWVVNEWRDGARDKNGG